MNTLNTGLGTSETFCTVTSNGVLPLRDCLVNRAHHSIVISRLSQSGSDPPSNRLTPS